MKQLSDTRRVLRRNDGSGKQHSLFLVGKKGMQGSFVPKVQADIAYQFTWQRKEPHEIARALSKGPVKASTKDINEVLRTRLRGYPEAA